MQKLIPFVLLVSALAFAAHAQDPVALIDPGKPAGGWVFDNGREFPGAQGKLELAAEPFRGQPVLSLHGDFTQGGNYVQAWVALPKTRLDTLSFWVNAPVGSKRLPIRYMDANDQVHQINLKLNEKGGWQQLVLPVDDFFKKMGTSAALDIVAGYETWDGGRDREKHQKQQQPSPNLAILASRAMETTKGTVLISDVLFHPSVAAAAIRQTIPLDEMLQEGELDWGFNLGQEFAGAQGGLDLVPDQPEPGKNAMRLHADFTGGGAYVGVRKSFARLDVQAMNVIRLRMLSKTTKSYAIRLVDGTGQCHQRKGIAFNADGQWHDVEIVPAEIAGGEHWGGANDGKWHDSVQLIELMLNVESHAGKQPDLTITDMRADVTIASSVKGASTQPIVQRVERVLLATDAVGNLFLPGDKVQFQVMVEAVEPLEKNLQLIRYSVRDYWGALQLPAGEAVLDKAPRKADRFVYSTTLDVPADRLAVGKYYELHVEVPQDGGDPVREYSGLAILPPAAAKKYTPEQVPFTIRNWDSRIPVYFRLADRLGLRLLGVWGGWSAKAPYKPQCPGIDLCNELGAKWITGTPASSVERQGFTEYDEDALRQGMANFLKEYAGRGLAMIAMGNEPHGTGQKVLDNVRAYKAIYETVKAFDPKIHVIGTSVEPNEEYFKAGYQNYLDSYDFHIYEHYTNVRRTIHEYRALMQKYNAVKPIHSTELGLNSQGQTRQAVAEEMIKKCTVFFAEGGSTVSWFTIQYPDPDGKARGQFGDSHCVFDCKYNLYNPRLDAVAYYQMVNGICDKKFVEERCYPNGAQTYLFRDASGGCLQVLWLDDAREDVLVPLPANQNVELVRLDGSRSTLHSTHGGISLTLSAEPVLLFYQDTQQGLAKTLERPTLLLTAVPAAIRPAATSVFSVQGQDLAAESLRVIGPPLWTITPKIAREKQIDYTVLAPAATPAREARIYVQRVSEGKAIADLTVAIPVAGND